MIKPLHQGISVPDMDASIKWYSDVLGFRPVSDEVIAKLNSRVVFMELGGFQVELFQYLGSDAAPLPPSRLHPNEDLKTCGVKHVAYSVENLPAFISELEEKGVDFATRLMVMNGDYVCFIRDNSGVLIEFIEPGGAAASKE